MSEWGCGCDGISIRRQEELDGVADAETGSCWAWRMVGPTHSLSPRSASSVDHVAVVSVSGDEAMSEDDEISSSFVSLDIREVLKVKCQILGS